METAFEGLESKAKPPSLEQQPIPDHPAQKDIRDREARDKAEAEAIAKKAREERGEDDDEEEETKPPTPEELKAKQEEEAKAKEAKEQKQETQQPPKKKGDFLREELAKVKSERDNFKAEIEKLKTAPKGEDPEKKSLQEKIASMEKRHAEIEDEYRLHSFEKSTEYKEKFLKPYQTAYQRGRAKAASLEVNTPEGALRPATPEDFDAVMMIQNDSQASRMARELFGDNAAIIIHHRERILEANEARANAIEEAKTTGVQKIKEQEETTTKQREAIKTKFMSTVAEREQKLEFLKPVEGDASWNEALERGKKLADRSWLARDGKTPDEQAEIDAANYARARAYSPLKLSVKRLRAENAELKAKLEKYKGSSPGEGQGRVNPEGQAPPPANAMEGAFASIEQRAKPPQFY
jgi:hypothetical protein